MFSEAACQCGNLEKVPALSLQNNSDVGLWNSGDVCCGKMRRDSSYSRVINKRVRMKREAHKAMIHFTAYKLLEAVCSGDVLHERNLILHHMAVSRWHPFIV